MLQLYEHVLGVVMIMMMMIVMKTTMMMMMMMMIMIMIAGGAVDPWSCLTVWKKQWIPICLLVDPGCEEKQPQ